MGKRINPYPEYMVDEASGIEVPDIRHRAWAEGYRVGRESRQVIKTVIKSQDGMVMVFDACGEQILEYQGQYRDVKGSILRDAPQDATFAHWFNHADKPETVAGRDW
ncbi:hypothetical protein ACFLVN_00325 [Chloroflexota bacterium]